MAVRLRRDRLTPSSRKISKRLRDAVPKEAYKFFVKKTPIRSGNARRRTKLINKATIRANYAYAERLDDGYSKQAPRGMTNPTINYIRKWIKSKVMRK